MTKLTLSIDEEIVAAAKQLAKRYDTSVSAMFANMVKAMAVQEDMASEVPPDSVAARLAGTIEAPADKSDRELLAEALLERYGIEEHSGPSSTRM